MLQSSESAQLSFFLIMSLVSTDFTKWDYVFPLPFCLAGLFAPVFPSLEDRLKQPAQLFITMQL